MEYKDTDIIRFIVPSDRRDAFVKLMAPGCKFCGFCPARRAGLANRCDILLLQICLN